ncbi:MAG: hypothetical protein HOV67_32935 [Kribbellaceae bacterium]|nr:hypothetical protein [Kribbellaceae bacterium]
MSSPPPGPNYSWQPQPGNYKSAPTYGQPPRKSRAGLILALIVVLALVALGAVGLLAYRLLNNHQPPTPTTAASPTPSPKPAPTAHPTTARPTARPAQTGLAAVTTVARQFITQLNANNPKAAATFACKGSEQLIPTLMQALLTPPTTLTPGQPIGQTTTYVIPLTGKTNNKPVTGVLVIQNLPPSPTCIKAFQVTPS